MHELSLEELSALLSVFERAGVVGGDSAEGQLLTRIQALHAEKEELESLKKKV